MKILETQSLSKHYKNGENILKAIDNVNLTIEEGEFVAIVGTSGSGKTTLLHLIGGLDRPTDGKVSIDGRYIYSMNDEKLYFNTSTKCMGKCNPTNRVR